MPIALEGGFAAGYRLVMNQDPARRDAMLAEFAMLDDFLAWQAPTAASSSTAASPTR